ncbi:MAG: tetratricopeptide repeat protein, partial [Prolixibacteraceae bacterium]|nr:tetratricopeptide repeat protein [Prolixibacteraceae bacterium]
MLKSLKIHLFNNIIFTIVLLGTAFLQPVYGSQEVARELFKAGKYAEALPMFEQLHQWYPNDETIQYELAVCLTETGQLGARPRKLLLQLSSDAFLPDRSLYLAKNFHAENDFETALTYYERYEAQANRKTRKKTGADALKAACLQNENPFVNLPAVQAVSNDTSTLPETVPALAPTEQITDQETPSIQETVLVQPSDSIDQTTQKQLKTGSKQHADSVLTTRDEPISQLLNQQDSLVDIVVSPGIQYKLIRQFRTSKGREAYVEGANLKAQLHRILGETVLLREAYLAASNDEQKNSIATTVTENEVQLMQLKATSDALMMQAIENEAAYWQQASDEERAALKAENESLEPKLLAEVPLNEVTPYDPAEDVQLDVNDTIFTEAPTEPVDKIDENASHI